MTTRKYAAQAKNSQQLITPEQSPAPRHRVLPVDAGQYLTDGDGEAAASEVDEVTGDRSDAESTVELESVQTGTTDQDKKIPPDHAAEAVDAGIDSDSDSQQTPVQVFLMTPGARLTHERHRLDELMRKRTQLSAQLEDSVTRTKKLQRSIDRADEKLSNPSRDRAKDAVRTKKRNIKETKMFELERSHTIQTGQLQQLDSRIPAQESLLQNAQDLVTALALARRKERFPLFFLPKVKGGESDVEETTMLRRINHRLSNLDRTSRTGRLSKSQLHNLTKLRNQKNPWHYAVLKVRSGEMCTLWEAKLLAAQFKHNRMVVVHSDANTHFVRTAESAVREAWEEVKAALHVVLAKRQETALSEDRRDRREDEWNEYLYGEE